MKLAIIGAGNVGGTLGRRWAERGHDVVFAVRDPMAEKVRTLLEGTRATASTIGDAVQAAEIVVLAVPWPAVADAIASAGDLTGKIVIDCTNPLKPNFAGLEFGWSTSAAEKVAAMAPGAKVVKIFNSTGFRNMRDPVYGSLAATMFYAGDDHDAKQLAEQLAKDLDFDPVDAGPLENARLLEPLAMLWIYLAVRGGYGDDVAFRLLRR